MGNTRPSWDEYFLNMVDAIGERSTCDRGKIGCVIVKDKRILATGYAGAPSKAPHCSSEGHQMKTVKHQDGSSSEHCVRTTHSEMSAVASAARHGVAIDGATIYVKMAPCYACAKVLVNCGIVRVVAQRDYQVSKETKELFDIVGIEYMQIENEVQEYEKQKI